MNTYDPESVFRPSLIMLKLFQRERIPLTVFCDKHNFSWEYMLSVVKGESRMVPRLIAAICKETDSTNVFWANREKRYWEWKRNERTNTA